MELEDEFHRPEEAREPLALTKEAEWREKERNNENGYQENGSNAESCEQPQENLPEETKVKIEEIDQNGPVVENILEQAVVDDQQEIGGEETIDVLNNDDSDAINYSQDSNGNEVVYQTGESYVEYAYQSESKNGEPAVQVEYLGSADVPGLSSDATVEYVTLAGDITSDDTVEGSRVIGVLRDPTSINGDYSSAIQYVPYPIRSTDDPLQTALNSAEVDKVDLMHFQVLGNGEILYERELPPPPPLFEEPPIMRDPYDRDSPMYTTLENANSIGYPQSMQPPSPSKYYGSTAYPPVTSSSYYYPHKLDPSLYSRPPSYGGDSIIQSLGSLSYLNSGFNRNDPASQGSPYDTLSASSQSESFNYF